ncbi:DUF4350 domain-containing protein [Streptomyces sp. t39]|uniref:DUF4350 domain-containing protein n=1 Tax=Streptomyces sp. t39 TaxID=1828156 RepID=UPI00164FC50D|nr:DUF4350 domain-containing protein [Streptomyces sp. t39]
MSLTGRQVWTRSRGLLLAVLLLVAAGITMAALRSGAHHGALDPRSADPAGSRAVAELLRAQGVSVRVVTTVGDASDAAGPDVTLLVTDPDLLTRSQQRTLVSATDSAGGRTVLLAPGPASLGTLAPGVAAESPARISARDPQCDYAPARRAGEAALGGARYTTDAPDSDGCYPGDGLPTLLRLDTGAGGDTVLLGASDLLHNEHLDEHGNASLALQLLGSRPELVWYMPSLNDPAASGPGGEAPGEEAGGEQSFLDLIPSGWLWGTLQLTLAAVLAAVWRGRRLGPLVTERLPVAVRASEATEGRARLYHKANARDRAAASLRSAARARLAPRLGVSTADAHAPAVLLPAVAAQLDRPERDIHDLLFGPPPADDTSLVLLADHLDALEREVRTA